MENGLNGFNIEEERQANIIKRNKRLQQLARDAQRAGMRPPGNDPTGTADKDNTEESSDEETKPESRKAKGKKRTQTEARSSGKSGAKKKKSDEHEDKKGEELKILNPDTFLKGLRKDVPEVIRKFRAAAEGDASKGEDSDLFLGDEEDYSTFSTSDILMQPKEKRKRPSAAEMRKKGGDETVSRDVPTEDRLSDDKLLEIGLASTNETNKERWRKAPYCWNEKGFIYEEYHHLFEKRHATTGDYIWNDQLLWKFARDHKVETISSRQPIQGLLNAKGQIRKRAPRSTVAQRTSDGRYIKDVPEARKLSAATKSQIVYERQEEIKGEKTGGVQRMRKERRDLEEKSMKANEMVAAANKVGPLLGQVIRSHVDEVTADLVKAIEERDEALKELEEARKQIAELTATRQKLLDTKHEYLRIHGPLPDLSQWMKPLNDSETSTAAVNNHHHSQHVSPVMISPTQVQHTDADCSSPNPSCPQDQTSPTHPGATTEEIDWVQLVKKQSEIFEAF